MMLNFQDYRWQRQSGKSVAAETSRSSGTWSANRGKSSPLCTLQWTVSGDVFVSFEELKTAFRIGGDGEELRPKLLKEDGVTKTVLLPLPLDYSTDGFFDVVLEYSWPGMFNVRRDYFFVNPGRYALSVCRLCVRISWPPALVNSV